MDAPGILVTCAACAAPLAHDAPRCVRCTLKLRWNDARALAADPGSTLDDIREAMTMLEDLTRITRRVFGSAHPLVALCEDSLRIVRKKLGASETPSASAQSTK